MGGVLELKSSTLICSSESSWLLPHQPLLQPPFSLFLFRPRSPNIALEPLGTAKSTHSPKGLPRPSQVGKDICAQHWHCQWTHSLFLFSPWLTQVVFPLPRAPVHQQHHGKGFTRLLQPYPEPSGGFLQQQRVSGLLPSHWSKTCFSQSISKNLSALNSPAGVSTRQLHRGFQFGMKSNYGQGAV